MKLIFFDIDGTLIGNGTHTLAESTREAVRGARSNGHICIVNTGRTWRMVGDWLPNQERFDGYLLGCGTMARYGEEILWHSTLSERQGRRIMEGLDRYGIDTLLEGAEDIYARTLPEIRTDTFRRHMGKGLAGICKAWTEAPGHFDKFFFFSDEDWRAEGFRQEFGEELSFIDREQGFWEVTPAGFSKGNGIRLLAERLRIPMEDTVAVGDSSNDLEMLQCAGTGIAMGNATQALRDIADYVTTDVMDDSIPNALKWLGVI
nr:HAD family hydrolase [uncultured Acetatifactor sp.]